MDNNPNDARNSHLPSSDRGVSGEGDNATPPAVDMQLQLALNARLLQLQQPTAIGAFQINNLLRASVPSIMHQHLQDQMSFQQQQLLQRQQLSLALPGVGDIYQQHQLQNLATETGLSIGNYASSLLDPNHLLRLRLQELQSRTAQTGLLNHPPSLFSLATTAVQPPSPPHEDPLPMPPVSTTSETTATSPINDVYTENGLLGPWSANSAGLLGKLAVESSPFRDGGKGRKMRKKPKDQPKRPLSAYNIFFKEERQRILNDIPEYNGEQSSGRTPPTRKRRKNPHGKIGFESLAKTIGQRWKDLDEQQLKYYKELASTDKKRYRDAMAVYSAAKSTGTTMTAQLGGEDTSDADDDDNEDDSDDEPDTASVSHGDKKRKAL
jgi:HMG-box domain